MDYGRKCSTLKTGVAGYRNITIVIRYFDCFRRIVSVTLNSLVLWNSGVPSNFFGGGSTNSAEDRGQRERGSGGGRPPVRGSTQFANE
jgi:hypothetical protein